MTRRPRDVQVQAGLGLHRIGSDRATTRSLAGENRASQGRRERRDRLKFRCDRGRRDPTVRRRSATTSRPSTARERPGGRGRGVTHLMARRRDEQLERLSSAPFDILVIGAGAIGAATAWYASLAGARVAVVDRGDVAGATSSASSKLMHGGLRYLAMGDIGLVQGGAPRAAGARPDRRPPPRPAAGVRRAGRAELADGPLAGARGRLPLRRARPLRRRPKRPHLAGIRKPPGAAARHHGLRGAVRYHDHQTHDARLAISALEAAADAGAVVATHAEVVALRVTGGAVAGAEVQDRLGGGSVERRRADGRERGRAVGRRTSADSRTRLPERASFCRRARTSSSPAARNGRRR